MAARRWPRALRRRASKAWSASTAIVTIADPGGVERSQGKARRVIDKRPKG